MLLYNEEIPKYALRMKYQSGWPGLLGSFWGSRSLGDLDFSHVVSAIPTSISRLINILETNLIFLVSHIIRIVIHSP